MSDTIRERPKGGWVCFFCDEAFMTPGAAEIHFGKTIDSEPACQIKAGNEHNLVVALRKVEDELGRYRIEDSDADRQFHTMRADHAQALIREEQKGYDRGLADGRAEQAIQVETKPWQTIETAPLNKRFLAYVPIDKIRLFIAMKTREGLLLDERMEPMPLPATHWMPLPDRPTFTSEGDK